MPSRMPFFLAPALAFALFAGSPPAAAAERVIFDTDVGGDVDDAGALAVLHALADRGEIEILAIGVVIGHELGVPFVDAVNTWYGRPDLPVGTVADPAPYSRDEYMAAVVKDYPHDLTKAAAPDAVDLYRRTLAAQPDRSVTLIAVGPATNVSRLLDSGPDEHSPLSGVELVRRKVKLYSAGGNGDAGLPEGKCGFNYRTDRAAARNELSKLPADFPTVQAGGSGVKLKIGSCYRDAPPDHVVRRSYEAYFKGKPDMDRQTWDQLRVLYGSRPAARALFDTSPRGEIRLGEGDVLAWQAEPDRNQAYAYVNDLAAMREELTTLMMHAPAAKRPAAAGPAAERPAAPWPPADRPLRVVIDTDAANEIDDQYALTLALGNRDRLKIEGLVAAHFGPSGGGGPAGIEKSYREIERVLDAAGLKGEIPVKRGVGPLADGGETPTSDGVEFILERARAATPDDPLWLVLLGPPTDAVAALEQDPSVADRLVVFWHVRSEWPKRCRNFNAKNDPVATRRVFEIPSRLVLFDTGTDLYLDVNDSERRYGGIGPLGKYLAAVHRAKYPGKPKAVFDLGDLAALVDPETVGWERTQAPSVDAELNYDFSRTHGEVVRIHRVDRGRSFDLLEEALKRIEAGR